MVSHQFKTPLASLQLSLETMAMRPLSPEHLRALIDRMLADTGRMEGMVTQILESMRLDRGRIDLRARTVELGGAVARVITGFEERAARYRVTVSADIGPDLQVMADPLALDVVLRNILENALAAVAPVGGGNIVFSGRRAAGEVELTVRDSGVGFARDALEASEPIDFVATELAHAFSQLGHVSEQVAAEEIVTGIFSRFCIGK